MRSIIFARATTRRLKTSVTRKIATKQPTVSIKALSEKKRKSAICVLKMLAVKNTMSHESPRPSTTPSTSAASDTKSVSMAMMRATCQRLMPSTWYRPNSFLRRFMMKLFAYTMRKPITKPRKTVRPEMTPPRVSPIPAFCAVTPAMSTWTEMVLNA